MGERGAKWGAKGEGKDRDEYYKQKMGGQMTGPNFCMPMGRGNGKKPRREMICWLCSARLSPILWPPIIAGVVVLAMMRMAGGLGHKTGDAEWAVPA